MFASLHVSKCVSCFHSFFNALAVTVSGSQFDNLRDFSMFPDLCIFISVYVMCIVQDFDVEVKLIFLFMFFYWIFCCLNIRVRTNFLSQC